MATDTSEFSYLPAQARSFGIPTPTVRRLTLDLADGRSLSALLFGDDPAVTLLHGAGLNAHTWDSTALQIGGGILAIDLAGHGDSSWRENADYTGTTLAPDIIAALRAWTTQPQVLVGQSLGGLTAAAVAASAPDLVRELIVVDITPGVDTGAGPSELRTFYEKTDFASREEVVAHALSFGFGGSPEDTARGVLFNTRVRPDGRVEWKHHFAHLAATRLPDPATAEETTAAVVHPAGWDDLAAVAAPLTLVRGTRGYVTPEDAAEFQRRLPQARIVEMDATHNVQESAHGELAALIRTALDN